MATLVQAVRMALHYGETYLCVTDILGEDVGHPLGGVFTATQGLATAWNTPLDERGIIGAAMGIAYAGGRPVAEIQFCDYGFNTIDLLKLAGNQRWAGAGNFELPIVVMTPSGAGIRGSLYHSHSFESWASRLAGWKIVMPSHALDAYGLMLSCIFDDDPCLFIENMPSYWTPGAAPEPGVRMPLGKAHVLRKGSDVTVISYSRAMNDCVAVADKLGQEGIKVELIDLRTIAPLDINTILESVGRTRRAVIVHEAVRSFGVGAEIAARIGEHLFGQLKAPIQRIGARECPVPFAKPLEMAFIPSQTQIEHAIRTTLK